MKPGRKQRRKEANSRGGRSAHVWTTWATPEEMKSLVRKHKLTVAHFDGRLEQPEEVKAFMARPGAPSRQQLSAMCWRQSSSERERVRSASWANERQQRLDEAFIARHCPKGGSK